MIFFTFVFLKAWGLSRYDSSLHIEKEGFPIAPTKLVFWIQPLGVSLEGPLFFLSFFLGLSLAYKAYLNKRPFRARGSRYPAASFYPAEKSILPVSTFS